MTVSRLRDIPGIGVDVVGDAADAAADPDILRLENLDTDLRAAAGGAGGDPRGHRRRRGQQLPAVPGAPGAARGGRGARRPAVGRAGTTRPSECVSVAGGLNGILNALLATVEPGQEVVLCDPIYAGLVNRVRLAGGVPRFVPATPAEGGGEVGGGWTIDPERLAAAVGPGTAAVLMMGPSMPTGLVLDAAALVRAGAAPGTPSGLGDL